ncbi:hypothetical protein HanRHA438_Chr12g0541501 [Helianthus annuus]|nr:hypothetical protein HanOQP8_Chr12g0437511 [Helianthus annuus]KAJ0865530.1 hypothetical protein HanRHA438_Chr12g0541501 [Helianthus annuus]
MLLLFFQKKEHADIEEGFVAYDKETNKSRARSIWWQVCVWLQLPIPAQFETKWATTTHRTKTSEQGQEESNWN